MKLRDICVKIGVSESKKPLHLKAAFSRTFYGYTNLFISSNIECFVRLQLEEMHKHIDHKVETNHGSHTLTETFCIRVFQNVSQLRRAAHEQNAPWDGFMQFIGFVR